MIPGEPAGLAAIVAALVLGGLVKGATGAGVPLIAVPVVAAVHDVRMAVVLMVVPNLVTNLWQLFHFRAHHLSRAFSASFAAGGAAGTVAGTALLAWLPGEALAAIMAGTIGLYLLLRAIRPDAILPLATARRIALPAGIAGGLLQGAAGISAPVPLSLLSAMRLERAHFIAAISAFFAALSVVQILAMFAYGLLSGPTLAASALALVPVVAALPAGAWLARRISPRGFDRIVLVLLVLLMARLVWTALA